MTHEGNPNPKSSRELRSFFHSWLFYSNDYILVYYFPLIIKLMTSVRKFQNLFLNTGTDTIACLSRYGYLASLQLDIGLQPIWARRQTGGQSARWEEEESSISKGRNIGSSMEKNEARRRETRGEGDKRRGGIFTKIWSVEIGSQMAKHQGL